MQAATDDPRLASEGLKSASEEYPAVNEELQLVYEQLKTFNAELDHRVRELARANCDFRNLLEATQIATIFLDNDLKVRSFTRAASELFDLLETDIGRPVDQLCSRIDCNHVNDDVRKVLTELRTIERDVLREGRSYIARILPFKGSDNCIAGAVITFLDVTSMVRAQSVLGDSEVRLRTLLAELQHRVRNTLAVVKSITLRTSQSSGSVEEMAAHLSGRLDAFARVQSAVTRNPDRGIDLKGMVADELLAHAAHEGEQVSIKGPDVALRPKAAESISLALHELTTNAVKHGALANSHGRIRIDWKLEGDGSALEFNWNEAVGSGKLAQPARHGFGMELLTQILPYDLDARTKVEFASRGLRFSMHLPLEKLMYR